MQSLDERDNVIQTAMLNGLDDPRIQELAKKAEERGAVQHRIGELPKRGELFEINGILYKVKFVDYKRGEVRIKVTENYKLVPNGTVLKIRKQDISK